MISSVKRFAVTGALAVLALTGVGAAANAEPAPHAVASTTGFGITEANFEAHLKGADLAKWKALTGAQKKEIVRTANDSRLLPNLTPDQAKKISPSLKVTETRGTQQAPAATGGLAARATAAATYNVTSHYQVNMTQFGVSMGWVRIDYDYVTGSGRVLADRSCRASYNQFVIGRNINVQTSNWVANGEGNCIAYWSISRAWGLAGTDNYQQGMVVNGPGIVRTWGP
ncbi:hypothetical protein [Arthrobacter woluwensis]|uniref:Uncharacterized protein n=1 Tax=Arthrobacter woluwensis TaxID=156980 RepID=A0A1H4JY91_9MICC|nr:hypothetical protein [Arthrobacter woluwensis]SEB50825.1 hypothetical protein SAMN04489745_0436 [Arthrobacter woluwensis]